MPRRGENIRKRKDGRWEGRYKRGVNEYGKTKYASVYGKTYSECKNKLETRKLQIFLGDESIYTEQSFRNVANLWLDINQVRIKKSTYSKYRSMLEGHIFPELGELKISTFSSTLINLYLEQKLKGGRLLDSSELSPAYVKTLGIIIGAVIKYAANEGWCQPLKTPIIKPSPEKRQIDIFSYTEQQQLERCFLSEPDNTKLGVYIVLQTGIRLGELCALSWSDIDFENKTINIRHTLSRVRSDGNEHKKTKLILESAKTKASIRVIPMSSNLFAVLSKEKQSAEADFVISSKNTFISTRTLEYRYKKMLKTQGLPYRNFHALRHTFATRCIEAGMDVKTLSEVLGHANAATTLNIYVHSSIEMKRQQIEQMCKYLT